MKAVKMYRPGKIDLIDIQEPNILKPQDVKIRVRYCAINVDDYNMYRNLQSNIYTDFGLLHEFCGEIVAMGSEGPSLGLKIGDRVSATPILPCGSCPSCRSGQFNLCLELNCNGCLAEYIIVKNRNITKLPKQIPLKHTVLNWLATNCANCIDRLQLRTGQSVMIYGGGSSGLMLTQMIKKRMPSLLIVSEPIASKRQLAKQMGADHTIDPHSENIFEQVLSLTNGLGVDVIIDACGKKEVLENTLSFLCRGGTLMLFSSYGPDDYLNLNLSELYWKECTIKSQFGTGIAPYNNLSVRTLSYLNLEPLIGKEFSLEQTQEAFEAYGSERYTRILIKI